MKPLLKYPGAKWRIAHHITPLIPNTGAYVEPFFGSGAVYFNLPFHPTHVILNDKSHIVVRFFDVLRRRTKEVCEAVAFTPWAAAELERITIPVATSDDIEFVRQFLISSWMNNGIALTRHLGFKKRGLASIRTHASTWELWRELPERLQQAADLLMTAEIECKDALDIINYYNAEEVTLYVDPPYLANTRKNTQSLYLEEMKSTEAHATMADALHAHKGPVVLSHYICAEYNEWYKDWYCKSIPTTNNANQRVLEVVWWNTAANKHLSQLSLF